MIERISFKNYKPFESGDVKLKPITILVGANSVGKSSILQLLLMLQQTSYSLEHKSALRLHGENVSLGEIENLFKNKDTRKKITLEFDFTDEQLCNYLNTVIKEEYISNLGSNISYYYWHDTKNNKFKQFKEKFYTKTGTIRKLIWKSKDFFEEFLDEREIIKELNLKNYQHKYKSLFLTDEFKYLSRNVNSSKDFYDRDSILMLYDFIVNSNIFNEKFRMSFTIQNHKQRGDNLLKVSEISLKQNGKNILTLNLQINHQGNGGYEDVNINSDYFDGANLGNDVKIDFLKAIKFNATIFTCISLNEQLEDEYFFISPFQNDTNIFSKITLQILTSAIDTLRKFFGNDKINCIGPLRAHPKRYYFLDNSYSSTLNALDGNSLIETLKEDPTLQDKVNDWLKKFKLSINVSMLQDIIHKLKVNQHKLDLDITDVGFGISQILPIIVQGFLASDNSLTLIEQPEIHLHPQMQADLADLFIAIIDKPTKSNRRLIIETHSEYLLRRLQRRIANKDGVNASDVAIYFVHYDNNKQCSIIEERDLSDTGFFEWPEDFYGGELLKDSTEFIKAQFK